ncbi:hypothetical protein ACFL2C_01290 [Patescibacteria group bacterium]
MARQREDIIYESYWEILQKIVRLVFLNKENYNNLVYKSNSPEETKLLQKLQKDNRVIEFETSTSFNSIEKQLENPGSLVINVNKDRFISMLSECEEYFSIKPKAGKDPSNKPDKSIPYERKLPNGWELLETAKNAGIRHKGELKYMFPRNWSKRYIYFKCLCDHYGEIVPYKTLYLSVNKTKKYPDFVTEPNKNIRSRFYELAREFKTKKLPIKFVINKGVKLVIK